MLLIEGKLSCFPIYFFEDPVVSVALELGKVPQSFRPVCLLKSTWG